ncbi:lipocalin family protein [Flavobacterium sp. TMP13]|uniref:lipocalin family protein n=1 Tax=Flavobacterium sp. TMP13 TaxID=3425950 RepID=UPI003D779D1D
MKKRSLVLALIAFIGIFAISCSSDDNEGETLAPIQGKWLVSQTGLVINGKEELIDALENVEGCDRNFMDLRVSSKVVVGKFNKVGGECVESTSEGTYSRSHNDLTTTVDGISIKRDIVNLTVNELKLKDALGIITVYKR